MSIKAIDVRWYAGGTGGVGAVLCEDDITNKTMAYIGQANSVTEQEDIESIKNWGAKLDKSVAEAMFGKQPNYKW